MRWACPGCRWKQDTDSMHHDAVTGHIIHVPALDSCIAKICTYMQFGKNLFPKELACFVAWPL